MVSWSPSVGKYVSTWVTKAPSRYTLAIPVSLLRLPIQLTDVPVKVNVARAPGVVETVANQPLHDLLVSPAVQPAVKVTSGSVSCNCETTCAGTSNASTTTTANGELAACGSVLFSPVTSIVKVWPLLLKPFATNTGMWTSYDLANMSTWDTK